MMIHKLRHWFTPHISNNYRAKILHSAGLLVVIGLFFTTNILIRLVESTPYHILGFTSSVTVNEVVALTNQTRVSQGLGTLEYSEVLADAARRKAANMFEENYWAHNSPSGKTPWYWFEQAGYHYNHAGENLAKDFGSTDRMMNAWMNSPTHRDNIVSSKYDEIGVAVVPGTLQGQETVLVVQLFGSRTAGSLPSVSEVSPSTQGASTSQVVPKPTIMPIPDQSEATPVIAQIVSSPLPTPAPAMSPKLEPAPHFDVFNLKKTFALVTTALLLLALVLDLVIAENATLARRVSKNWAHIMYINVILILVTIVQSGSIL